MKNNTYIIKNTCIIFRTWSDREIRTLLSRLYPLPLDYSLVVGFENAIMNCSNHIKMSYVLIPPLGERYLDSSLVSDFSYFII